MVHALQGHTGEVNGCAISADGRWVVSASDDKTVKIWNRESGEMVHSLQGHTNGVRGCAMSADGKWVVSASDDGTLKIWARETGETGETVRTLQGHGDLFSGCAVSADGRWIVSASSDKTLKVWEMQNGKCLCTLPLETPLYDVHFSSESPYFAVAGEAGVYFFELVQGNTST